MSQIYECVLIFDVQISDEAREKCMTELKAIIEEGGGAITETVPFGIRKLAYEIKGRQRGDYRVIRFAGSGDAPAKMDRVLRLKEEVVRHMFTKFVPPKQRREFRRKAKRMERLKAKGEASDAKPEQSAVDGEHHEAAGA